MSASEPPELPEPEVEYRRPAWVEPPADVVPGIVPVERILARTSQRAIGLTGIRAYPAGFGCTLHLRLRDVIPGEQSNFGAFNMFGDGVDPAGEFADYYLRFGVGFADGRKATNLDHRRDLDEGPAPDPPTLRLVRWEGYDRLAWEVDVWVWGLPPPGPLAFVCEWPGPQHPRIPGGDRRRIGPGGRRTDGRHLARPGCTVSFFELPAWRPPSDYRVPTWARGPEGIVPGVVPVALLLVRTNTHAVLVDSLLVYPAGFDFDLAVRRRPGQPRQYRHRPRLWDDELRLEVRFADGRSADNDPRRWPRPVRERAPDPPLLYQSTRGPDGGHVWLWGLPPPGPVTFACQWPSQQIPPSQAVLNAGLVLEAAARAQTLWPDQASSP